MAKKKILWVEDDEEIISAFKPLLESQQWEVISASSAEKSKAMAEQVNPDLIIMDIIMVGEHGYSAIEDLKKEAGFEDVPIIVFSGVTHRWGETTASLQDALTTKSCEFVDKAEKPEALINTISKYLNK